MRIPELNQADKAWIEAFCQAADPYNAALVRFMSEIAARIAQTTYKKTAQIKTNN